MEKERKTLTKTNFKLYVSSKWFIHKDRLAMELYITL